MAGTKRKISEVEDVETQPIPSVKNLASSESKVRRQALLEILAHFQTRPSSSPLTLVQCQQLWRGFHVAVYMHDSKNAISVQNLISTLANTFSTMRSKDKDIESTLDEHQKDTKSSSNPSNTQKDGPKQRNGKADDDDEEEFNGFDDDNDADEESKENQIDDSWLSTYTTAFWTTIIREWATIDSHRMNKYLLLIRLTTRALFTICIDESRKSQSTPHKKDMPDHPNPTPSTKRKPKNPASSPDTATATASGTTATSGFSTGENAQNHIRALISSQVGLLSCYPLNTRDSKIPNGLRIHMLDIYVDELERVIAANPSDESGKQDGVLGDAEVLTSLKQPLQRLAFDAMDRNIRNKAKDEVKEFESRLESNL